MSEPIIRIVGRTEVVAFPGSPGWASRFFDDVGRAAVDECASQLCDLLGAEKRSDSSFDVSGFDVRDDISEEAALGLVDHCAAKARRMYLEAVSSFLSGNQP